MQPPTLFRAPRVFVLALLLVPALSHAQALELSERGSFITNTLEAPNGNTTYKGVIVKLGKNDDAAICFDTELLRLSAAWVRGEAAGHPTPAWAGLIDPRNSTALTAFHGGPPMVGVYADVKQEKGKPGVAKTNPSDMMRVATKQGPGWAGPDGTFADPRTPPLPSPNLKLGPLPRDYAHWKGLYVNGDRVVFSYTVGSTDVLETPGLIGEGKDVAFTRTFHVGKSDKPLTLAICDTDDKGTNSSSKTSEGGTLSAILRGSKERATAVRAIKVPDGATLATEAGRCLLKLPASAAAAVFKIVVWSGAAGEAANLPPILRSGDADLTDPATLTKGGSARWGDAIETAGKVGAGDGPYVVDTLTPPEKNPWHALVRFAGFDFFPDGKSAALCTIGGDVWVVSGIDEKLEHLKWKRYATGLFQALGLKISGGEIYVLGRDQITRLHDLNRDGEADFYENFNNDTQVTTNYHEFCLDLQTDREGNFYFPKGAPWPPTVTSDDQGVLFKVSKDGSKMERVATGLRAPNGTGMSPDDVFVASDNQGHWEPACKVSWLRPGKFYGMVPSAHSPDKKDPTSFEQPIFWLPMNKDNSSGGEAFAPAGDKWGPGAGGHMVHLSYGMSSIFLCSTEMVDGVMQGAAVPMGLKFESSAMRARFSPADGQLYLCGLKGWQTNAGRDGALHRVRYTGKPVELPTEFHARANGIEIGCPTALDKKVAADPGTWAVEQWNYKWTGNYGSPEFSPKDPNKKQHDDLDVKKVRVSEDGKTVFLEIDGLGPVDQMKVTANLKDAAGKPVKWEIYNTIQKLGPAK
jgi:hypothetical protein